MPLVLLTLADLRNLTPPTVHLHHWTWDAEYAELRTADFGYPVMLTELTDPAKVLDIIAQVAQKQWATPELLGELTAALVEVLNPQATMCGSGVAGKITPNAIARRAVSARIVDGAAR